MNASNTKAHSSTTQKVKKNNRTIEKLISSYRADPEAFLSAPEAAGTTLVQPKNIKITTSFNVPSTQAEDDDSGFTTVGKLSGDAFATLISIVESRGKKGVDKEKQVSELESLLKSTQDTYLQIIILLRLIPIKFDLAPSGHAAPINVWNEARDYTTQLLDILENNASKYQLSDSAPEPEDLEKGLPPREDGVQEIPGSIVSLVERLDDEFTRSLLEIDPTPLSMLIVSVMRIACTPSSSDPKSTSKTLLRFLSTNTNPSLASFPEESTTFTSSPILLLLLVRRLLGLFLMLNLILRLLLEFRMRFLMSSLLIL